MRRILISSCMFLFLFAANNVTAQEKVKAKDDKTKMKDDDSKEKDKDNKVKVKDDNGKMKMKGDGMAYPYTAGYSSNFVIGNPAHAKLVLNAWKDWEDNTLDRADFIADTITLYTSEGQVIKGKDATLAGLKKSRSGLTSSKVSVDAWVPLKSTDRNEDWVAIWGSETDVSPDGKSDSYQLHEVWRINKDGKVDMIRQFSAKMPPQQ